VTGRKILTMRRQAKSAKPGRSIPEHIKRVVAAGAPVKVAAEFYLKFD
jgi:hypothetical protein